MFYTVTAEQLEKLQTVVDGLCSLDRPRGLSEETTATCVRALTAVLNRTLVSIRDQRVE